MNGPGLLNMLKKGTSLLLVMSFLLEVSLSVLTALIIFFPSSAFAAQVVIEGSPNTTAAVHTQSGASTVFISDQVGYKFYRSTTGTCVYRKTTNGGTSWNAAVAVDTQTDCISISVWYDQWTPGDTGTNIHISTIDTGNDELFYNRLDTSSDTLLLATAVTAASGLAGTFVSGTNENSITKATDGYVYMVVDDANGSQLRRCLTNCDVSGSWSTPGTLPQGNFDSWSMLMPLSSGNVMLINRSTTNTLQSSIWNGTSWSGFTTIDASAVRNTTYDVGVAATLDTDTGDIYIAYITDHDTYTTADHDLKTAVYSAGSWSSKTAIFTNLATRGLMQVAISRDQNNGDIYVGYTARSAIATATTGNVFWRVSTDGMTSWGGEQGPMDTSSADMYGIDMNLMSFERIFVSWYDVTATDVIGDTVVDTGPQLQFTSFGTQSLEVRNNRTDVYLGGGFALTALGSYNVTNVTVSENGTIHGQDSLKNIKLFYDLDTSSPYNCASESYSGSEPQFGSTATNGFSGADGVAAFTASPIGISPTATMCLYVTADILPDALDGETIELYVSNPELDVLVVEAEEVYPNTAVLIAGTTEVVDPNLTQFGFHWRNDNGSETTATSATLGSSNTALSAIQIASPRRLRIGLANQGSTSTSPVSMRLEYALAAPTCNDVSSWSVVNDPGADWLMSASGNITDGANTTNISEASGGVADLGGTSFVAANGALRDTNNTTSLVTYAINQFIEAEYSIVATSSAAEGSTYCFRLTEQDGTPLSVYSNYPSATIAADVTVSASGTKTATVNVPTANVYAGGVFVVAENSSSRDVTSVTLTESGTVDGDVGLSNLRLRYDLDTTAPYNCASESYSGSEAQYGSTITDAFSGTNETAVISGSENITTTRTLCLYPVYDVTSLAQNNETVSIGIAGASSDVIVSGGASVGPSGPVNTSGITTIAGPVMTQSHYHIRNDDGNETAATSATGGVEDTPITDWAQNSPIRLRFGVTNAGAVSGVPTRFRLEYAPKITTCDAASVWTDVDASADGWDMYNSSFLTNGANTTDIAVGSGGVSNGVGSFIAANGGVSDTSSLSATNTIAVNDYLDLEYSITSTDFTSFDTDYCFRVSSNGIPLNSYLNYAEITTAPKRDFKIQRGSVQVSGTSAVVTAGVDYTAPASTSLAFVRITNSHMTGAGNNVATAGQNADDVTAYISNPENIGTSFTISRPAAATSNTRVDWEIVEFIGKVGTDNEIQVRGVGTVSYTTTSVVATGTAISNISDPSKVVVFVTGARNNNTSRNFYASLVTSDWNESTNQPVFTRGASGASTADISYAVVEFTGQNWNIQRVQHAYTAAGVIETEPITAVNSLGKTFIHAQKRMGATTNVVHYGHEVWLSSIGALSFQLETGASVAIEQTSVAWVIENIQNGVGAMEVQRSNGLTSGGTGPLSLSVTIPTPIDATNNTSISANTRAAGANTTFPRPQAGFSITSTTTYQIWRSNTGSALTYRVEIIEWPVADLSIRQNYYRFYVDNNSISPVDPWPLGFADLGENTSITVADEPLGTGDRLRVRMTLHAVNANMPAGLVNFKLQYAQRATTCSAIGDGSWLDVGGIGGSAVWRGYAATGTVDGTPLSTNPPTGGDLLISVANRSGVLSHENPSEPNPYSVIDGDYIEYDWNLEHNGALPQSTYCFRVVRSDGTPLDAYNNYPQIRTAGYSPVTRAWRWYGDVENETPTTALSGETVAPINIANNDTVTLRVSVKEKRNVLGENIKFKLQFSEDVNFTNPIDVAATSTCSDRSYWCYTEGAGVDNAKISTSLLSDSDSCVASVGNGCGTHNTSPQLASGFYHEPLATTEYSFNITHKAARVNAVYYFRLYDVTNEAPVTPDTGESYPSLVTEGPTLQLSLAGLPAGTSTAGVITDVVTTPTGVAFGTLDINTEYVGAHRVTVSTNATEGYQLFKFARHQLLSSNGSSIPPITATNALPQSWSSACAVMSTGCFGYHSTDPTLKDGSTRFAASDTYAALDTSPSEVMYSSIPTVDTHDIVYRIKVNELQPAGNYETEIVYLAVPSY